jgi:hypothetical protein
MLTWAWDTCAVFGLHYDDHHANTFRSGPAASKFKRLHWLTTRLGKVICQAEKTTGCSSV